MSRRWLGLGVLCASLLAIVVDNTIVNVALPTLARDLEADVSDLQWVVDAYTLVFAGLLLLAGALGDRYGRPAAALIMPATLSLLIGIFPDPRERSTAIGIWAATAGLGVALGPVVGGFLLDHFAWGSIFIVNIPLVIVAIAGGRKLLPESSDPAAQRIDWPGAALSSQRPVHDDLGQRDRRRGRRRGRDHDQRQHPQRHTELISAQRALSNAIHIKVCNLTGAASAAITDLPVRVLTIH